MARALRALSVLLLFGEDLRDGSNHVSDVFARRRGAGRGRDMCLGVGRRGFFSRARLERGKTGGFRRRLLRRARGRRHRRVALRVTHAILERAEHGRERFPNLRAHENLR